MISVRTLNPWTPWVLVILAGWTSSISQAQTTEPGACSVADFRRIALTVGNPTERLETAKAWLVARGPQCETNQLNLIQSNLPGWLGSALNGEITVMVETLQEAKLAKDPIKLKELFNPDVKTFEPSTETATNPKPRSPVVNANPPPGVIAGAVVAAPVVPAMGVLTPPPGSAPSEDPAKNKPPPARFKAEQRLSVKSFFEALYKDGKCPPNLKAVGNMCVSEKPRNWKLGDKLSASIVPMDLPAKLAEILGPPNEGFKYGMVNEDILVFSIETREITDSITDFGGINARQP